MHLIDAKCNSTIITSLFHFASTFATQNVIKNQNEINYYIITKRAATVPLYGYSNLAYHLLIFYYHAKCIIQGGGRRLVFFTRSNLAERGYF